MNRVKAALRRAKDHGKVVSATDAMVMMILSAAAAVAATGLTAAGIAGYFNGPVTLGLPLATTTLTQPGLQLDAEAHFTSVEATIPALPTAEATLLAWAGALNLTSALAVLALFFLLAFRLRAASLFTPGSVWIIGACGSVLALAGSAGQILDSLSRTRLAEAIGANQGPADESLIFMIDFNLTPVVAGAGLMLVAGVFQFGGRLQKDTEGLV